MIVKAREKENKGDILLSKGLYQKALYKYEKAIKHSRDRCVETEANSQFKIGKIYFEVYKDFEKAITYLVDFQLLTYLLKVSPLLDG